MKPSAINDKIVQSFQSRSLTSWPGAGWKAINLLLFQACHQIRRSQEFWWVFEIRILFRSEQYLSPNCFLTNKNFVVLPPSRKEIKSKLRWLRESLVRANKNLKVLLMLELTYKDWNWLHYIGIYGFFIILTLLAKIWVFFFKNF